MQRAGTIPTHVFGHDPAKHGKGTICPFCERRNPRPWVNPYLVALKKMGRHSGDVHGGFVVCDECAGKSSAAELERIRTARLDATGIPRAFHDCTWETFDRRGGSLDAVVDRLSGWDGLEWAYLFGPVGTGKTRAAVTMALDWKRQRSRHDVVRFVLAGALLEGLRPSGGLEVGAVAEWGLLVVDDIGAEKPSEWSVPKLVEVLQARWDARRPTVITSNRDLNELAERMGDRRLTSRVAEWCRLVKLSVPDYRIEIAKRRKSA